MEKQTKYLPRIGRKVVDLRGYFFLPYSTNEAREIDANIYHLTGVERTQQRYFITPHHTKRDRERKRKNKGYSCRPFHLQTDAQIKPCPQMGGRYYI